jgi:hypothetical protein
MAMKIVKRARRTTGMAMGAALMYFCDPQLGAQRRRATKDRVASWWQGLGQSRRRAGAPQVGDAPQVVVGVQPIPPLERVASAS